MIWSRRQASDQIVQATHLSTPHPKLNLVSNSLLLGQFWSFLRNFKHSTAVLKITKQLFEYVGWLGVSYCYEKMPKLNFRTIQVKILSQNEPKIVKNETSNWVKFFSILRPFKGYQTAFVVCKMVRGVPMIPRNNPDNILVQTTLKYWAKMGQKLKK